MGKKNNRRRKFRPNQQMRRNPKTGKVEKFEGKKSRVEKPKEGSKQQKNALKAGHKASGFVPTKPQPRFRPCVCEGTEIDLNNNRLLDLLKLEKRAYNEDSETITYLVSSRFRMKHARHMRHFRKFLRDEGISLIEV